MRASTRRETYSTRIATTSPISVLASAVSPVLSWQAEIQPVPLHRARIAGPSAGYKRWAKDARGHGYLVDVDEDFRDLLRQLWMVAKVSRRPLEGRLVVAMRFAGCNRSARGGNLHEPDLSNLIKAVEDAGNKHLWRDDAQIKVLVGEVVAWGPKVKPFVQVQAWELAPESFAPPAKVTAQPSRRGA